MTSIPADVVIEGQLKLCKRVYLCMYLFPQQFVSDLVNKSSKNNAIKSDFPQLTPSHQTRCCMSFRLRSGSHILYTDLF